MPNTIGIDARKLTDFGIGTYIKNLVESLAELDSENRYVLFTGRQHRDELGELPENFQVIVESSGVYSLRELATLSWRLLRLRLDLYHATHYVLPAFVPCRAVVTIHDIIHLLYPEFLPRPLAFFYAQRMIRRSLLRGDRIIAISDNTREDLTAYFDVDDSKIEVVYPGVSDHFRRRRSGSRIDETLEGLGISRPYVLFVGNPKPHKNLDRIVRAFARALRLQPFEADLVCVGDRGLKDFKIRSRAEQLGLGDRVRLLGHVDEDALAALYQGARLFLYPTLYEGFGLPVVEAMASGTAVVTSSTSALREVASGYAELVDPLDVEEIARAIARCVTDEDHRRHLAEAGRKRADDFRWSLAARRTLEIYQQVLSQPWEFF